MGRKSKEKKLKTVNSPAEPIVKTAKTEGMFNKPFIHVLAIIFITFLIYSNTFNAPFQFDDAPNIVDNPAIKDFHYFSDTSRAESIDVANNKSLFKTRYIGYLTFALNYRLHGLDVTGYHLINIFVHMFNSLLLYWLMTLTFRTPFFLGDKSHQTLPDGSRSFIAFCTALFFAVHPIQTQAVTYIVQRFTSLATLFYLMSLVMYVKWREVKEQQTKYYWAYVMFYVLSLLSAILAMKTKEFAFTLPVVMAMYELMFFNGKIIKRLLYLIPFFLAILLIPLSLAGTGGSLADMGGLNEEAANMSGAGGIISRGEYLFTQCRVIVTYIRLLFIPVNQNIDYDYPVFRSFFSPAVVLSFLFLLSIIIAGIYLYRLSKRPERKDRFWLRLISFGIFWFFITLSAESGVIPIRDVIFEHRVYLPSVGFFLALTAEIGAGMERWGKRVEFAKKSVVYVMIMAVLALSGATYARNAVWKDSVSLWENAVKGSPNKARPYLSLGLAYADLGRIAEAINEFQTAISLKPDYAEPHNNLGNAYATQGRLDEAIAEYQIAFKLKPNYAEPHNNLGYVYAAQGRSDEAIKEYQISLKLKPDFADAYNNLGNAYADTGRIDEAIKEYQSALKIKPNISKVYHNIGHLQYKTGNYEEAIRYLKIAIEEDPSYARAFNILGLSYIEIRQYTLALENFDKAIALDPDLYLAYNNRGIVYAMQKKYVDAIKEFSNSIQINHSYGEGYENRGMAYTQINQKELAVRDFQNACRLGLKKACDRL